MSRINVQTDNFDIGAEFTALTAGRTDIGGIGCLSEPCADLSRR
jgi:molybdopterin synthase catalytic subunit